MLFDTHFNNSWLRPLFQKPMQSHQGIFGTSQYTAKIILPNYRERLTKYYAMVLTGDLFAYSQRVNIPFTFSHYGVIIDFDEPTELVLHDDDMVLNNGLREIIAQVGPVIIRNAYLTAKYRDRGHRNRFAHLNFHVDRSENQPTHYSMYTRDPFDDEQKHPRTASTLFIPSILGSLQGIKEGLFKESPGMGVRGTYTLFTDENMSEILGNVVIEQSWDRPEGIGEIAMLDNCTALHASYYRDVSQKAYKIGVRYLA